MGFAAASMAAVRLGPKRMTVGFAGTVDSPAEGRRRVAVTGAMELALFLRGASNDDADAALAAEHRALGAPPLAGRRRITYAAVAPTVVTPTTPTRRTT